MRCEEFSISWYFIAVDKLHSEKRHTYGMIFDYTSLTVLFYINVFAIKVFKPKFTKKIPPKELN